MALFKFLKGNRESLSTTPLVEGHLHFCQDDGTFFVDFVNASGELERKQVSAKDAETLSGLSLEQIKKSISWNDLQNKPFREEVVEYGSTITWDGVIPEDNSDVIAVGPQNDGPIVYFVHVADNTPNKDALLDTATSNVTLVNTDAEFLITRSTIISEGLRTFGGTISEFTHFAIFVINYIPNNTVVYEGVKVVFNKTGIYFVSVDNESCTKSLTLNNENFTLTKTVELDTKFLPTGGFGYSDAPKVLFENKLFVTSPDCTLGNVQMWLSAPERSNTIQSEKSYYVTINGKTTTSVGKYVELLDAVVLGNFYLAKDVLHASELLITPPDTGEDFLIAFGDSSSDFSMLLTTEQVSQEEQIEVSITKCEDIHKIFPKFLPEGGFGYENVKYVNTLTWDGTVSDDAVTIDFEGSDGQIKIQLEYVSEDVLTIPELDMAELVLRDANGTYESVVFNAREYSDRIDLTVGEELATTYVHIILQDTELDGISLKRGIYFLKFSQSTACAYPSALHTPLHQFKKRTILSIDPKFLPTGGFGYDEKVTDNIVIEFDGDISDKLVIDGEDFDLVKVSDLTPDIPQLIGAVGEINGQISKISEADIEDLRPTEPCVMVASSLLIVYESYSVYTPGIYLPWYGEGHEYTAKLSYSLQEIVTHKIDPKFLPEMPQSGTQIQLVIWEEGD